MNLEKMQQTQRKLDERIVRENNIEFDQGDLLANTFVAFTVEFSEFANATGWFKNWKKNHIADREKMLDEYADCLHFFLSLANQIGFKLEFYEFQIQENYRKKTENVSSLVTAHNLLFLEVNYDIMRIGFETQNKFVFQMAFDKFLAIGIHGYNFTPEQIEEAYYAKNKVNHQRQDGGY